MFKKLLNISIILMLILITGCEKNSKLQSSLSGQDNSISIQSENRDTIEITEKTIEIPSKAAANANINSQKSMDVTSTQKETVSTTKKATDTVTTTTKPVTTKPTATTSKSTTTTTKQTTTTTKATTQTTVPTSSSKFVAEVLRLCNIERQNAGLAPLVASSQLNQAAAIRANEIITSFSHTRPNGTSCFTVLKELNISYNTCGENIAAGQTTPQAVVTAWMNSEGHRANILNPAFNKLGVGYTTGGNYGHNWAQMFSN